MLEMTMSEKIEYWKKVKETIHVFDRIVVQYIVQWSAVMLGMIGASAVVYPSSSLIAGTLTLTAIFVSIPIGVKCFFYYQLLERALLVAEEMETLMFKKGDNDEDLKKFGLTYRLGNLPRRRYEEITFFGWTIFLPFVILAASSITLSLVYFHTIETPGQVVQYLFGVTGVLVVAIFFINFALRFGKPQEKR